MQTLLRGKVRVQEITCFHKHSLLKGEGVELKKNRDVDDGFNFQFWLRKEERVIHWEGTFHRASNTI